MSDAARRIIDPGEERLRLAGRGRAAIAADAAKERSERRSRQREALVGDRHARSSKRVPNFPYHMISTGRKVGKPIGSHLADLVALRQTILLCEAHAPKFNATANGYFHETKIQVGGECDACREPMRQRGQLFIHESLLGARGVWQPL